MRRIPAAPAAMLVLLATAAHAAGPFPYGMIQSSCAPWDGPAIEIRLTAEPVKCKQSVEPFISIGVWRGLPLHSGQVVKFGPGSDAGYASRCKKEGDCERFRSGTVVFDRYEERSRASGHYELNLNNGETLKGTFDVKWCNERVFCG